ncbi:hypothetical protein [Cellulophaga sp. BC115SP]|uniref:hypothetical protein n=1 Tax=Cellulophaga sp. BC115SP TaxID=2683263 RepID=UPI001411F9C3|nr:hypothetical protein [Cellulophaga sp. BC115SP]NBB31618.1 hypothetical protein [Cellulophaga sp. BC115SP]
MNQLSIFILKSFRRVYSKLWGAPVGKPDCLLDADSVSDLITQLLSSSEPCMVGRFGSTELSTTVNYLGVRKAERNLLNYVRGQSLQWWWNNNLIYQMNKWSGFFPANVDHVERFCEMMVEDMGQLDILGSWLSEEKYFENYVNAEYVHLRLLEPFWSQNPWTKILKGKKILVIHPFDQSIKAQYSKRHLLFQNSDVLPEFGSLSVIKAVQTLGQESSSYIDWFEALDSMKKQIDESDFDICLIGAGAYGFPLAAYVKRIGKKAIHLGGALQLLFGIKGKRWEDPNYGVKEWGIPEGSYTSLINEYWVRPMDIEKPITANFVEGACYW